MLSLRLKSRSDCSGRALAMLGLAAWLSACSAREVGQPPAPGATAERGAAQPAPAATAAAPNGFVYSDGEQLKDGAGEPLTLRGVNLGGWLLWEGWIWGGGFQSESTLQERLEALAGREATADFRAQVYASFITEADIARIAELGFNVVRLPFHHQLLEDEGDRYVYKASGWEVLDRALDWCAAHDVYVVLTLHAAPGGQSAMFTADPQGPERLWASEAYQARTVALWKAIAERYRDRAIIAGYDLLNEPVPPAADDLIALYADLIAAIRSVDPNHLIIVEGAGYARDFSIFAGPLTHNQAYSFHMYTWFGDNRKDELEKYREVSSRHNLPMWNGEFGENSYERLESTVALFQDPAYGLAGWAFWTWKKAPNRYPYLLGIRTTDRWDAVMRWIEQPNWPNPQPTQAEALQGMDDFLAAIRFENNVENPEMIALLSQGR